MNTRFFIKSFILFGFSISAFGQNECAIADYPFDNNANNTVSSNFHGTIHGTQITEDRNGVLNSAYEFDGQDDYISVNNQPVISSSNFTITAWANMAGTGGGVNQLNPIFVQRNNVISPTSSLIALFAQYNDDKVTFLVRNQASGGQTPLSIVGDVIDFDEWHFYAAVKDSSSMTLYVDSIAVGTIPCPALGPFNTGTDNADIGRHYYSGAAKSFFNGAIDDVQIFNCALSEDEILDIYSPEIKPPVGVVEHNRPLISYYQNSSLLEIKNETEVQLNIKLYSIKGDLIKESKLLNHLTLDITDFPNSVYIIKVSDKDYTKAYKLVKYN